YKFFTLNFLVEVHDEGYFRLRSLMRTQAINCDDIYHVDDKYGFIRIFHKNGKTSVTELIDGISSIKSVFPEKAEREQRARSEILYVRSWPTIFKVFFASVLFFYGIYVEIIQLNLHAK